MQKLVFLFLFIVSHNLAAKAQKISGQLKFEKGKSVIVDMEITNSILQQPGGQAINFLVNGAMQHCYKVSNAASDSTSFHHTTNRLKFDFDGLGQKKSFDSELQEDKQSPLGKQFEEFLSRPFDITVDKCGKTLMVTPDTIKQGKPQEEMVILTNMLKEMINVAIPPQKGNGSFFKVLPAHEVEVGDTWADSINTDTERSITTDTLTAITDSTIIISFQTNSITVSKSEIMGGEATTTLNNITTGKIILDRNTHIIREKRYTTTSKGNTEAVSAVLPISGKLTVNIWVSSE